MFKKFFLIAFCKQLKVYSSLANLVKQRRPPALVFGKETAEVAGKHKNGSPGVLGGWSEAA